VASIKYCNIELIITILYRVLQYWIKYSELLWQIYCHRIKYLLHNKVLKVFAIMCFEINQLKKPSANLWFC
jgi:hypothetical protein